MSPLPRMWVDILDFSRNVQCDCHVLGLWPERDCVQSVSLRPHDTAPHCNIPMWCSEIQYVAVWRCGVTCEWTGSIQEEREHGTTQISNIFITCWKKDPEQKQRFKRIVPLFLVSVSANFAVWCVCVYVIYIYMYIYIYIYNIYTYITCFAH